MAFFIIFQFLFCSGAMAATQQYHDPLVAPDASVNLGNQQGARTSYQMPLIPCVRETIRNGAVQTNVFFVTPTCKNLTSLWDAIENQDYPGVVRGLSHQLEIMYLVSTLNQGFIYLTRVDNNTVENNTIDTNRSVNEQILIALLHYADEKKLIRGLTYTSPKYDVLDLARLCVNCFMLDFQETTNFLLTLLRKNYSVSSPIYDHIFLKLLTKFPLRGMPSMTEFPKQLNSYMAFCTTHTLRMRCFFNLCCDTQYPLNFRLLLFTFLPSEDQQMLGYLFTEFQVRS